MPFYLIDHDGKKFCSACGALLNPEGESTIERVFVDHVRKDHPAQIRPLPTNQPKAA